MRTKTIKIKLRPDRETGEYYAEMITDVSLTTVQHAFDSLTRNSDGRIIKEKARHTKGYYFKRGIKSVFNILPCLINSIVEGVKYSASSYKEQIDAWENNND